MDACFLVTADSEKVNYIETIKGKSSVDTINRCVKFVLASLVRNGKNNWFLFNLSL